MTEKKVKRRRLKHKTKIERKRKNKIDINALTDLRKALSTISGKLPNIEHQRIEKAIEYIKKTGRKLPDESSDDALDEEKEAITYREVSKLVKERYEALSSRWEHLYRKVRINL